MKILIACSLLSLSFIASAVTRFEARIKEDPSDAKVTEAIGKLYAAKRTSNKDRKAQYLAEARALIAQKTTRGFETFDADIYRGETKLFAEPDEYIFAFDIWDAPLCYKGKKSEALKLMNRAIELEKVAGDEEQLISAEAGRGNEILLNFLDGPNEWEHVSTMKRCRRN